jgi:CAAX prenyl protease-like protein
MAAYLVLTQLEAYLPETDGRAHPVWYPLCYAAKFAITAALAWLFRANWSDFRAHFSWQGIGLGVAVGVFVTLAWVGLDGRYPAIPLLGSRSAFDPRSITNFAARVGYVLVRGLGLVVLVPLIEELFWRSFLMRFVIDPDDFRRVPIGRVTWLAGAVTAVLFALAHPEWLPALLTGAAWALLLHHTKSLAACLASHVTANLLLICYTIATNSWRFV